MGMIDENLERNGYDEFSGCEGGEMRVVMAWEFMHVEHY